MAAANESIVEFSYEVPFVPLTPSASFINNTPHNMIIITQTIYKCKHPFIKWANSFTNEAASFINTFDLIYI